LLRDGKIVYTPVYVLGCKEITVGARREGTIDGPGWSKLPSTQWFGIYRVTDTPTLSVTQSEGIL